MTTVMSPPWKSAVSSRMLLPAITAAAFAATGQLERARDLAERGLRTGGDPGSADVAAWVLGGRDHGVQHRATLLGVDFDAFGRLRLDALFRPREVLPERGAGKSGEAP